ncbi:MAG: carboxylesterase [Legionellales bacterium]|nr:carboxylesterase [Legionellales bacterium]
MLETIIVEPQITPTHSVIWLHGLGADGHDFELIMPELQPQTSPSIRFILPHAPTRQVSLFGGMPARAWFDIFYRDGEYGYVPEDIVAMATEIEGLIDAQIASSILPQNIFLAGFSQGGAMAVYAALTSQKKLGGILGLSTFMPIINELFEKTTHRLPVLIAHGTADDVVPFSSGVALVNAFKEAGFPVTWHSYPIAHGVSPEEIQDIRVWFEKRISLG